MKKVKTKIIYEESIQEDDDILESVTPKDIKLSKHQIKFMGGGKVRSKNQSTTKVLDN